jgi:hypothetical protein
MGAAEGNHELVADPAAERPRLGESQVVGVRRPASTQQTRLRGYKFQVRTVTIAARFAEREGALKGPELSADPCVTAIHLVARPAASRLQIYRGEIDEGAVLARELCRAP